MDKLKYVFLGFAAAFAAMFFFGAGLSYADKPAFCGSCHSMGHVYRTWQASQHKQFSCGDCHLPQNSLFYKLYVKGENGMRHTYHETLRDYPVTIAFTPSAKVIADGNCLRCHGSTVQQTHLSEPGQSCTTCHRGMVHGQGLEEGVSRR